MLESESGVGATGAGAKVAAEVSLGGWLIEGFDFSNIIEMRDGSLMTEDGFVSRDVGRSWQKSQEFKPVGELGVLRLPNGDLGTYCADRWDMATALGNATNNWFFKWSSDEGQTWSEVVKITLDGLTQGLKGTMFNLRDGNRSMLVTYSQFLGSRFDKRGGSWGTLKGIRFQIETEAHFPLVEVCRAYYSDDNGHGWKACDGWIMGWREKETITDAFTEGHAVELKDGRIMMIGRTLTG